MRSRQSHLQRKVARCRACSRRPKACARCGAAIRKASVHCWDCHLKFLVERNKMHAAALAKARASKTWRKRTSKLERQAQELLDVLGLKWIPHVAMGPFILDLVVPELSLAVDVRGSYWHSLPDAIDRDRRREETARMLGYRVLVLHGDQVHLWWRLFRGLVEL